MASYKIDRMAEDIKRNLADIFRELKDPRISQLLSVVRVEVSGDMSYAKVFVSAIEGYEQSVQSVKGLKSATGYIKRELSARMKMRKMPELRFVADNSIEHGAQINRIIEEFEHKEQTQDGNED